MKTLQGFSHEYLASLFAYDALTGVVTRKIWRNNKKAKAGDVVGSVDGKGYLHVAVEGKFIRVHRLGYFLATGEVPKSIDHADRVKTNNALINLRPCVQRENSGNSGIHRHNTSGFRGVSLNSRSGKWCAQIKINGKQTYLGRFETPQEAARCYDAAAREHFGAFATLNHV